MYGADDFENSSHSIVRAKTPIGYYITEDFFALCVGNRDCFFASMIQEVHPESGQLLGDCCHWIPHLGNFRKGGSTKYNYKDHQFYGKNEKLYVKDEFCMLDLHTLLSTHEKTEPNFLWDENIGLKFGSSIYYTHPVLNISRTPLFWTLKWVRGIDKTRKLSKKSCICKSRDNLYTAPCINPWHYNF